MKFLLEYVTCGVSCSPEAQRLPEETKLLIMQEPRRRVLRKHGRIRGGGCSEWRPSLSSISEDELTAEKINNGDRPMPLWQRFLQRKVASISRRDRSRSLDHQHSRRAPVSAISSTPVFMF